MKVLHCELQVPKPDCDLAWTETVCRVCHLVVDCRDTHGESGICFDCMYYELGERDDSSLDYTHGPDCYCINCMPGLPDFSKPESWDD